MIWFQVGPNAQTCLISNANYEMQFSFFTGSREITQDFIVQLEVKMRQSLGKPPGIMNWDCDDLKSLKNLILAETTTHPVSYCKF